MLVVLWPVIPLNDLYNRGVVCLLGDAVLYESLKEYIMNEEKLIEHNYPLQNPERPGSAILFADNKKTVNDRQYSPAAAFIQRHWNSYTELFLLLD